MFFLSRFQRLLIALALCAVIACMAAWALA